MIALRCERFTNTGGGAGAILGMKLSLPETDVVGG
jgi:hypothetical protein